MSLKDRIDRDRRAVFTQESHFADKHTWNGQEFTCTTDEESALKRKNNNVVDVSWDNNTREVMIYVAEEDLPGRAIPNEHVFFDSTPMKVLQVQNDMGMLTIVLVTNDPRAMGVM